MTPEAWAAFAAVVVAGMTYLGTRYASKQSRTAQVVSAEIEQKAVDAAAYERARDSYEAAIANYQRELERLDAASVNLHRRIVGLNEEILTVEESKRDQYVHLKTQLERAERDCRDHMSQCNARIQRLRDRLAGGELIPLSDPDLQLHT